MKTRKRIRALPPVADSGGPTVGEIKRALHDIPHAPAGPASRDYAQVLREVHDLVRRLARLNGVDPDEAVQRRRDAVQVQRESMSRCR